MSDDAPAYWNAFNQIFNCSTNTLHLLCHWHVDRNWRKRLNTLDSSVREQVYKKLCILRLEPDESKFLNMLKNFLHFCRENKCTEMFADYFENTYSRRTKL
jgi:hypothetical protein